MSAFSRLSCTLSAQARTTRRHISKLRRKTVDFSPKVGTFSKKAHDFWKKIVDFCAKAIPCRAKKGEGAMKNRGKKQKRLALFAWKKRASREKERQRRKTLPRRPTGEGSGERKLENERSEEGAKPGAKGISAPLSPLRLPNARRRCRAPRSYRRHQPAAFPARSARPICGRGDFRIRPAHKWHW